MARPWRLCTGTATTETRVRREQDSTWGKHVYKSRRAYGTPWKKVVSWFGFTLHLAVDAQYELPIAYRVTPAAAAEVVEGVTGAQPILGGRPGV